MTTWLKPGYGALLSRLARPLDIRLDTRVQAIVHDDDGVQVETSRGMFNGEAAVCAFPLGVLKAPGLRFDPVLPSRQRAAVARLGTGVLDKIALRFPTRFWPDVQRFARVDGPPDRRAEFYNLHPMHGEPILVALVAGDRARALEAMPEAAAVEQILIELRSIFGKRVSTPERVIRTRWGSDPFALGSYSRIPPGASLDDFDALAEAPGERLFMAGEATVSDYPGTVHGALMSGLRAAGEVADALG